uniref:alpha/beta fold hydrolase n=1 Tax=Mesorhizobium sp. WSM4875 TaxID=3038539 RepID=UPI0024170953|nr:alpha/beta hydrolase [Mesorhizobium sp. WSM4875]WIE94640.1 alpha/beta hydrolase [Mesorhizobium sp. WSM4875]
MASAHVEPAALVGSGAVRVIAVPGWMGDHRLFEPMLPLIDPHHYRFAILNPRGYGNRLQENGPYTVEQIAADILACADTLGWKHFIVIGHSMAGMAVQKLLVDAPDRVDTAILIAPVPASGAKLTEERRELLLEAARSPDARKRLIDANTGKTKSDAWVAKLRDVSVAGTRPEVLEAYMASWAGLGFERELKPAKVPVRVLLGELDPGANPPAIKDFLGRTFSDLQVSTLAKSGHYPMWEMPVECMQMLEGWILS